MKHGSDDMPIACGLTSAALGEREATLLAQFRSAVIETEELRDGYAVPSSCTVGAFSHLSFMLPSAHIYCVGVRVVSFVGSRTGAVLRRFSLAVNSGGCPRKLMKIGQRRAIIHDGSERRG